jgi:hypothetical protein
MSPWSGTLTETFEWLGGKCADFSRSAGALRDRALCCDDDAGIGAFVIVDHFPFALTILAEVRSCRRVL